MDKDTEREAKGEAMRYARGLRPARGALARKWFDEDEREAEEMIGMTCPARKWDAIPAELRQKYLKRVDEAFRFAAAGEPVSNRTIDQPVMNNQRQIGFDDGYRAAVRDVLWLAEARGRYQNPDVKPQVQSASHIAAMLGGAPDEAWGWLPSWLWDEWAARRASCTGAWADTISVDVALGGNL